jgi:hypothetical protein
LAAKLARVKALETLDDPSALTNALRKALADKSNYVVAKAAAIAASRYVEALVPDLLTAFDRMFVDALKTDPLVVGKLAIARALKELDVRDPAPFVRGLQHEQFEPVWGDSEDHAGGLRAACAHALVACDIEATPLLRLLVERLVDDDVIVRRETVRAIASVGGDESVLLIRLKALAGDPQPDVCGECFAALLDREGRDAVEFIERFARGGSPVAIEAVSALASSRVEEAIATVQRMWSGELSSDVRRAIVYSCGASALPAAGDFLVTVIADARADLSGAALEALAASRFRNELRARAEQAAISTGSDDVLAAFARAFESG